MEIDKDQAENVIKTAQFIQENMAKMIEESGNKLVRASSGGGMVTATANWKIQIVSLEIEKEVVNPDDKELLQDLIVAAVNEALMEAQKAANEEMLKISSQISPNFLGGLLKPPF
jgi:DNA-binding YbaB/EbfC family protein